MRNLINGLSMIKIYITKNKKKEIDYIKISGHANSSQYGEDIVCAAVSSVSQMTLNGILEFIDIKIKYELKEGLLICDLRDHDFDDFQRMKLNILLDSMLSFFNSLYEEYRKYIILKIKEV